jgi:hypothetical protein
MATLHCLLELQQTISITIDKHKRAVISSNRYRMHDLMGGSFTNCDLTNVFEMISVQPQSKGSRDQSIESMSRKHGREVFESLRHLTQNHRYCLDVLLRTGRRTRQNWHYITLENVVR